VCGEVWSGVSKGKECVCVWCILLNWRGCPRYGRLGNCCSAQPSRACSILLTMICHHVLMAELHVAVFVVAYCALSHMRTASIPHFFHAHTIRALNTNAIMQAI